MITISEDTFTDKPNIREITFRYNDITDNDLLKRIIQFISDNQPTCFNCINYYTEGGFGGYNASCCKIHGCIESLDNPHHDADGAKCSNYTRQNKKIED